MTANVSAPTVPAPTLLITPNVVSGVPGMTLSSANAASPGNPDTLATFIDPNSGDTAGTFSILINWGDNLETAGSVVAVPGTTNAFAIQGDHDYTASGTYPIAISIVETGKGPIGSATSQATITPFKLTGEQIVEPASRPFVDVPVATFTDGNPADAASTVTALINWGDGDTGQGVVTDVGGVFTVDGSYTYPAPGTYQISVTLQNQSGQSGTSSSASTSTADVVNTDAINNSFAFSVGLAPIPANGPNAADGLTITNRPTFVGTAPPYSLVVLTANRIDVDAGLPLGRVIADGNGQWTLPTGPLADGIYDVTGTVTPPGGYPQVATNPAGSGNALDQFVVDTQTPRVVAVSLLGQTGNVVLSLAAGVSGLNLLGLLNPANYTFTGAKGATFHPASVTPVYLGNATTADPQSVVLAMGVKSKSRPSIQHLTILATQIANQAGTPLQAQAAGKDIFTLTAPHPASTKAAHGRPREK